MTDSIQSNSSELGIVTPLCALFESPLQLASGRQLANYEIVYETYGQLNADKSNAVLICHALNAGHHAAGWYQGDSKAGWWNHFIGPGKPIDSNLFYVVSPNNLGGCHGSTGPASIDPDTGKFWGANFPGLRFRDWVNAQKRLMHRLEIDQWAAVVGSSLGGMQAMRWSLMYPDLLRHAIIIASTMNLSAENIAYNQIARRAIQTDPDYCDGDYLNHNTKPKRGLAVARMVANLTYIAGDKLDSRFGRQIRSGTLDLGSLPDAEFEIESYINHQGDKFTEHFDANTYLLISRMLDIFDLAREYEGDPITAFSNALCKFLVIAFSTDWRFPAQRSRDIAMSLMAADKSVSYAEIDSPHGHDSFLLPHDEYEAILRNYMLQVATGN